LIAAGVLSALIAGNMAMAADVPAGVQLADKQTLVRNNGAEPQSLDPHKIEGVPEANISRDLFEGLLNTSPKDGHPIRAWQSWDNKDFKVWTFHLRKDAKWSNGEPVTAKTSFIAGSVWWIRKPRLLMPAIRSMVISNVDEIIDGKKKLRPNWA
jgi:oligopeptide transport system substrate-binding protein